MLTFAHIVNPFATDERRDIHLAQPITFESMRRAKEAAEATKNLRVKLYATRFAEDRHILPAGFEAVGDLEASILDYGKFEIPRKLPLFGDILRRLYERSEADYFVYTNVDIGLHPNFYIVANDIAQSGCDAFFINRRIIEATPAQAQNLEWLLEQEGFYHPGDDCFVFRREILAGVSFFQLCIGMPAFSDLLREVMPALAPGFRVYDDLRVTFHINDDMCWLDARQMDYFRHGWGEALKVIQALNSSSAPTRVGQHMVNVRAWMRRYDAVMSQEGRPELFFEALSRYWYEWAEKTGMNMDLAMKLWRPLSKM